jgi:predicted HicB family RNase H-like nuclease
MQRLQRPENSAYQTNRTATIGFRVEPYVKEAAERAAAKDRRSLSSLLEKVLIEFLSAQHFLPGQDA